MRNFQGALLIALTAASLFGVGCGQKEAKATKVEVRRDATGRKVVSVEVDCNGATERMCDLELWVYVGRECTSREGGYVELETKRSPTRMSTTCRCREP